MGKNKGGGNRQFHQHRRPLDLANPHHQCVSFREIAESVHDARIQVVNRPVHFPVPGSTGGESRGDAHHSSCPGHDPPDHQRAVKAMGSCVLMQQRGRNKQKGGGGKRYLSPNSRPNGGNQKAINDPKPRAPLAKNEAATTMSKKRAKVNTDNIQKGTERKLHKLPRLVALNRQKLNPKLLQFRLVTTWDLPSPGFAEEEQTSLRRSHRYQSQGRGGGADPQID